MEKGNGMAQYKIIAVKLGYDVCQQFCTLHIHESPLLALVKISSLIIIKVGTPRVTCTPSFLTDCLKNIEPEFTHLITVQCFMSE